MPYDAPLNRSVSRPRSAVSVRTHLHNMKRVSQPESVVSVEKFKWLRPDQQSEPVPVLTKRRLLAAQKKAEETAKMLDVAAANGQRISSSQGGHHVGPSASRLGAQHAQPDDIIDGLSSLQMRPSSAAAERPPSSSLGLVEAQQVRSGFDSTPFTPYDPQYYNSTPDDVSSTLPENPVFPARLGDEDFAEGLNTQTFRADKEVPSSSAGLPSQDSIFGVGTDEALNKGRALFQSWWRKSKEEIGSFQYRLVWVQSVLRQLRHSTSELETPNVFRALSTVALLLQTLDTVVTEGEAKKLVFSLMDDVLESVFVNFSQLRESLAADEGEPSLLGPSLSSSTRHAHNRPSEAEPVSLQLVRNPTSPNSPPRFEHLATKHLYCERAKVDQLRAERTVTDAKQRLADASENFSRRSTVLHQRLKSMHCSVKSLVFHAWRKHVSTKTRKRAGVNRVVSRLSYLHDNTILKVTFLAMKYNSLSRTASRTEVNVGDQVREWRKREAKFLLEISTLRTEKALLAADHKQSVESIEQDHWAAQQALLGDTKVLRERAESDAEMIQKLSAESNEFQSLRDEWRALTNALLSELCPSGDRSDPQSEFLYMRTAEGHKLQLTPFETMGDVVTAPSAANRVLLFFSNTLLRRLRPSHALVENLGMDLADCEVYFCALISLRPDLANDQLFEISGNAPRAKEVCRILGRMGLDTLVSPVDLVLGVVLRNLALLTSLFRLYATTTRHGSTIRDGAASLGHAAALSSPTDATANIGMGELLSVIPRKVSLTDIAAAKATALHFVQRARAWNYLSDFVQRDTLLKIQNVRREGEVLDERRRRWMEWFLHVDEEKVKEGILDGNAANSPNEFDKVAAVIGSFGFDFFSIYAAYAADSHDGAGGGCRMSQASLLRFYEDLKISSSATVLEDAYRFATSVPDSDETTAGYVFAPTAVGAQKRKLTPFMAALPVSPKTFVEVIVYLSHFKFILGGKRLKKKDSSFLDTTTASDSSSPTQTEAPPTHHAALRRFVEEDVLSKARFSVADKFRSTSRGVQVQQLYKKFNKQLVKAFRMYCTRTVDGEQLEGGQGSKNSGGSKVNLRKQQPGVDSLLMTLDDYQKFCRDFRLMDARLPQQDVVAMFSQLIIDEEKLQSACRNFPHEREPQKSIGIGYAEFLDCLSAIATFRHATPFDTLHMKVEALFKETMSQRLKEMCGNG